tara:strand:- start:3916 stop:4851 length:936 start_codon:yes stop_codon:yes gene_type:complete
VELKNKKIILKSPAKINLHLEVLGKRKDGYHELSMIMQSIDLSDFIEMEFNHFGKLNLDSNSNELSSNKDNLIIKTANILKSQFPNKILGANIFLKKNIPIGAGLAGGSSNAAATLIGLNKLWELGLSKNSLHQLASQIGSDVPFFIEGGTQYCFGRGEILEKYKFDSKYYLLLLKNPNVSISTSEVYSKYYDKYKSTFLSSEDDFEIRRNYLRTSGFTNENIFNQGIKIKNDLQKIVQNENKSVYHAIHILSKIKECLCFSMSGSGPSCYAIFDSYEKAKLVYDQHREIFLKYGLNSWLSKFITKGITII